MTHHIHIGIDPGLSGAIAVLQDGECPELFDMPLMSRRTKGKQVNAVELASILRSVRSRFPGASFLVITEEVASRPKQGVVGVFRFGESVGVIRGVIAALGLPSKTVTPQKWKKALNLIGTAKDAARVLALELHPGVSGDLSRKRDGGRADALLIATWAYRAEVTEVAA